VKVLLEEEPVKTHPAIALGKIALVVFLAQPLIASAADIKLFTGFGLKPVLEEIGPEFERNTKHKLAIEYTSTFASKGKIEAGEPFDVAILGTPEVVDELVKQGKLTMRTIIARSGMGVAVREGAPKPAIDSAEAFKRTLLNARSVAYNADGVTAKHMTKVFEQLGIADQMKAKTKAQQGGDRVMQSVAGGEADVGLSVSSQILTTRGVQLAGLFPRQFQEYVTYTAGVSTASKDPKASKALIDFLTDERATPVMKTKGLERVAP
jgi:molybdate transport system substrate-binding protein